MLQANKVFSLLAYCVVVVVVFTVCLFYFFICMPQIMQELWMLACWSINIDLYSHAKREIAVLTLTLLTSWHHILSWVALVHWSHVTI